MLTLYLNFYTVTLTVRSEITDRPLIGAVYFFLHDSYNSRIIQVEQAFNNQALIQVGSYEAFTVGAYVDATNVKLELDLNEVPGAPEDYKYSDHLLSYDELRQELDRLKQQAE